MKFILSCWDVLPVTRTSTIQKSMSQNGDPKIAISMGKYSIEGPDVGFMGGSAYIHTHTHTHAHGVHGSGGFTRRSSWMRSALTTLIGTPEGVAWLRFQGRRQSQDDASHGRNSLRGVCRWII